MIASTAIIHPNVRLGKNVIIEDFCIIGMPSRDYNGEETVIGDNSVIRAGTYLYAGSQIGSNFQTGNRANIREFCKIGNDVSIGSGSTVEHRVEIGHGCRMHGLCFICEFTVMEDNVWIGPHVALLNSKFPRSPNAKQELRGPVLKNNCKIGGDATILPGVVIGENSLIGAGSVVTKDIDPNIIAVGNPAKFLKAIHY